MFRLIETTNTIFVFLTIARLSLDVVSRLPCHLPWQYHNHCDVTGIVIGYI